MLLSSIFCSLSGQGELDDGRVVTLVPPRAALPMVFGLPSVGSALAAGTWVMDGSSFIWVWLW